MTEPSVAEMVVARLEGEMAHGYHTTADCTAFAALIADWRKRGEALAEATAELIYLRQHGKDGAVWWANDSKDVWREKARAALQEPPR